MKKSLDKCLFDRDNEFRKRIAKLLLIVGRDNDAIAEVKNLSEHKDFENDDAFLFFSGNMMIENGLEDKGRQILAKLSKKNKLYGKMVQEKFNHKDWQKNTENLLIEFLH